MPTVDAWRQVNPPPPQQMERRPSFEGQAPNVGRLGFFAILAVVVGAAAFYWVGVDRLYSLLLAVVFVVVMWGIDLAFTTGFTHKLIEQRTEQQRIAAALVDAAAINTIQDETLALLWANIKGIEAKIEALDTFKVHEQGRTREIMKMDAIDIRIKTWITEKIFDSVGKLSGVHSNGQIKGTIPFKSSAPDDSEELQAYERLVRAGLLGRRGDNYIWTGPLTLTDTFKKLEAMR